MNARAGGPRGAAGAGAAGAVGAVLPPLIAAAALLALWQAVAAWGLVPADMLPAPTRIASAGAAEAGALARNAIPTLLATLAGFALSVTVAFLTATLLDFSGMLRRAILPLLIVSQTLPLIALAPLVVLWFGFGLWPKILLVAFVTYFPMVVGFLRGFASAEPEAEHLLRSMGAGRAAVFRRVRLPSAVPSFFSSLRISITYAVVGAIFAEYAGAVAGLGVYMQSAKNVFRTDLVLAAVLVSTVLTLALYGAVVLLERVCAPWVRVEQGAAVRGRRAAREIGQGGNAGPGAAGAVGGADAGGAGGPAIPGAIPSGALELAGVGASRGGRPVLRDVSLAVGAGEIVALVGPSGSGKSTLLSLLTGALAPDAGAIRFAGAPVAGRRRPFAYMPQRDVLLPWRSVLDNAAIGLEVDGTPRAEARARAARLFAPFGIAGAEPLHPRQLSGGMRQRVSFVRAVVPGRPVLLLDEPFGALDAITRDELQQWLLGVWAEHGWSILLITHDIREAVRLADRVLVLPGRPGPIAGEVAVERGIPRDDRFLLDPRVPPLESRLHDLLRDAARG